MGQGYRKMENQKPRPGLVRNPGFVKGGGIELK